MVGVGSGWKEGLSRTQNNYWKVRKSIHHPSAPRFIANPEVALDFVCLLLRARTGTESHVEASLGVPATLCRKINH